MINRLKQLAHILLIKTQSDGVSPMRALVELNHKVISENDSFILNGHGGAGGQGSQ